MDTAIPFITTSAWLFATSIATAVLVSLLLLYLFNRRRIDAITDLGGTVADLIAKEELLKADLDVIRTHILDQKEELLRVDGEREKQENLRIELDELTRKTQAMDSQNQGLRNEVGQLELEKHQHAEKIRQIAEEMQTVGHQRDAAAEELKTLQQEIDKRKKENAQELSRIEEKHKKDVEERMQALDRKLRQKEEAALEQIEEHKMLKEGLDELVAQMKRDEQEAAAERAREGAEGI